jgi:hypothetical protein
MDQPVIRAAKLFLRCWSLVAICLMFSACSVKVPQQKASRSSTATPQGNGRLYDVWRRLDQLVQQEEKAEDRDSWVPARELTSEITAYGDKDDFQRMLAMGDRLLPDSKLQSEVMDSLCAFWIRLELPEVLGQTPPKQVVPDIPDIPAPSRLAAVHPDLIRAWRIYKAVISNFDAKLTAYAGDGRILIPSSQFFREIRAFFHEKDAPSLSRLVQYKVQGIVPADWKERTLWMAFLKERDYAMALGALVNYITVPKNSTEPTFWPKQFMEWCGVDWEALLTGAALDGQRNSLRFLGLYGSRKTALYLSLMGSLPKNSFDKDFWPSYLSSSAAFISKGCALYSQDFHIPVRYANDAIPEEIQRKLLDTIVSQVNERSTPVEIETVSYLLRNLCRPDTRDTLRRIAQSPYYEARVQANIALNVLGEPALSIADLKPTNFRILINGVPFANKKVMFVLSTDKTATGAMGETDSTGLIGSDLNDIINQFKQNSVQAAQAKYWQFEISSFLYFKGVDDPVFTYVTDLPHNLNSLGDISIKTSALILNFRQNKFSNRYKDKMMEIQLAVKNSKVKSRGFLRMNRGPKIRFQNRISLQVMPGIYDVRLSMPGSLIWEQFGVEVGDNARELSVDLYPGSNLEFDIVAPGGPKRDKDVFFYLLPKGGAPEDSKLIDPINYDMDWHHALESCNNFAAKDHRCIGLAPGEYELVVLSSEEKRNDRRVWNRGKEPMPFENPEYQGEKRTIVIDEASPPIIDLGPIELKPQ